MIRGYFKISRSKIAAAVSIVAGLAVLVPAAVYASLTPNFTQTINAGTLSSDIYQSNDTTPVSSPSVAFTAQNYSFQCQTSTGTLGDSNDKVNVTNLASGINTWNLALAATGGNSATWTNGTNTYAYNNNAGSPTGCTSGQLSVNPAAGTVTDDCNSACSANDSTVSKGSSSAFLSSSGSTAPITIISDSAGTAWEGYMTGVSLSQTIPPLTPSGSYSLGMTLTLTHT